MDHSLSIKERCEWEYSGDDGPTTSTVLCTFFILVFTLLLEVAAHSHVNCCNIVDDQDVYTRTGKPQHEESLLSPLVTQQPLPEAAPQADAPPRESSAPNAPSTTVPSSVVAPKKLSQPDCCNCCVPSPPPNIRANRLIVAMFLYAIILFAFITRIQGIAKCQQFQRQDNIPGPNWWAVVILNILPFSFASLSLLRTVVDCFLVRWGIGLRYIDQPGAENWTMWPVCVSFFWLSVCVREVSRVPITWLMGVPRRSAETRYSRRAHREENIEMGGEELSGLADGIDAADSDDERYGNEPPAYDDAVHGGVRTGPAAKDN